MMSFFKYFKKGRKWQGQPLPYMARAPLATLWRWRVLTALLIVVAVFGVEFYALKLPQAQAAYTIANSARLLFAFLGYGILVAWQRRRRKNRSLISWPVSLRARGRIFVPTLLTFARKWICDSDRLTFASRVSSVGSTISFRPSSTNTRVGSGNWRLQSFLNSFFASSSAARQAARGCGVFSFV